jgi:coenzyme F420-0:L-glutamate ligase/coenzyme F420-1:gamma-L-glutamate ligase
MTAREGLLDHLRSRRSVRRFGARPVPAETIERLLEAARLAPSAHNRQPWRFAVVTSSEMRARLAEAMASRLRRDRAADGASPAEIEADVARSRSRLTEAPCAIVVCLTMQDMDTYPDTRRSRAELRMAIQSVAMAGENMLLAAAAEGLGSCWMCAPLFAPDEAAAALDLPSDWEPQGMILLGDPAETPDPKPRRPSREVTVWR